MSAPPEQLAISKSSEPADATTVNTDRSPMVHENSQRLSHVPSDSLDILPDAEPLYTSVKRLKSEYADGSGSETGRPPEVCCNTILFIPMKKIIGIE